MPLSESRKKSNVKWDSVHLKRMSLAVPLTLYEQMSAYIQMSGETMNGFIKRAIIKTIQDDQTQQRTAPVGAFRCTKNTDYVSE